MSGYHNFAPVFEAWAQKPYQTNNGHTVVPAVGTHPGQVGGNTGFNSHFTYDRAGNLDHYSVYNGGTLVKHYKL